MTAIPAKRLCLGTLTLICSLLLLTAASPAEAGKCTKRGTNGDDVLRGTKKADVLCGRGGDDVLLGKRGKDQLLGSSGDDTLKGGPGADRLRGQGGSDTADYATAPSAVTVNLANGAATGDGDDTTSAVENVVGSPLADILTGDAADNLLAGGDGDDLLAGGAGADTLDGGAGADKANYFAAGASIDADLLAHTATGQGSDSLPGIENVTGSPQDDTLAGDLQDNVLHGGAGTDTVSYAAATSPVTLDLAADTATGMGNDSVPAIENVTGSPQADTLAGDPGANAIDGGAGTDSVSYASSAVSVTVDLVNGTASGDGADTLSAIEEALGSDQGDAMIGDGAVNRLDGGDGPDLLTGGAGSDQLLGGDGNDDIYGEPQNDDLAGGDGDDLLDGGAGTDQCDGGPGNNQFAGGCDTAPPQVDDFSIAPAQIDTLLSSRNVTFTIDATDLVAGIDPDASKVSIATPNGDPRGEASLLLVSGDKQDGTYEATIAVPRFAPQGTWTVSLSLVDRSGNAAAWSSAQLIAATFPGTFAQTGAGDEAAPALADFSITPGSIDTSGSAQVVTFGLDVTDAPAGVDEAASEVTIASPNGQPKGSNSLQLVSGTPTSGSFEAAITVPKRSPQGTWTVSLSLVDAAGNHVSFSSAQLIAAGEPGTFQQTGVGDDTAPVLTSLSLTPSQINTSSSGESVTFTLHATDDLAGVDAAASSVVATSPIGDTLASTGLTLMSGNSLNGVYRGIINVPQGSVPGTWTVSLDLRDEAGNRAQPSSGELIAAGYPGTFTNVGADPT